MISMVGTVLYLTSTMAILRFWRIIPIHLIIFCSIFQVIGGGTQVLLAVLYSIAADVESSENRCVSALVKRIAN